MGRISASTGLITGFPIASTVSQLIQLESGPVNNLTAANTTLQNQQTALTQIEAQLIALQSAANNLSQSSLYSQRTITSSDPTTLSAVANTSGNPPPLGNYVYTPLQQRKPSSFSVRNSPVTRRPWGRERSRFASAVSSITPLPSRS